MPQISDRQFERLPLRVHQFLAGIPLLDVWAVDLPSPRAGIALDKCLRAANERLFTPTQVVRGLLDLRLLIGRRYSRTGQPDGPRGDVEPRIATAFYFAVYVGSIGWFGPFDMAPIDRPKTDRFCCHALEQGPDNGSP